MGPGAGCGAAGQHSPAQMMSPPERKQTQHTSNGGPSGLGFFLALTTNSTEIVARSSSPARLHGTVGVQFGEPSLQLLRQPLLELDPVNQRGSHTPLSSVSACAPGRRCSSQGRAHVSSG